MKILVATDGSQQAASAIALMKRLVGLENHEFALLSISDARDVAIIAAPIPGAVDLLLVNLDEEARLALKEHSKLFSGVETIELLHRRGDAADTILGLAEEMRADLIVMGSRGLGPLSGPLLGSVSHRVAAHSRCSVLLGRRDEPKLSDGLQIILGIDGSQRSTASTEFLSQQPLDSVDQIQCVQVLTLVMAFRMDLKQKLSAMWAQEQKVATENLATAVSTLRESSRAQISSRLMEGQGAGEVLVELAKETATDLLVVGYRGLGAVRRFLLGSVSSYLLHQAPCGVLIVKDAWGKEEG